jgi:hypothetical protein
VIVIWIVSTGPTPRSDRRGRGADEPVLADEGEAITFLDPDGWRAVLVYPREAWED